MRPILITGFGAFRDVTDNPSGWLARRLDGSTVAGRAVIGVELPVAYAAVNEHIPRLLARHNPIVAIATGVGRPGAVRIERLARNAVRSEEPDVAGQAPVGTPVVSTGAPTRPCRWDAEALTAALHGPALAVESSSEAGGYVCDAAFYVLVHHLARDAAGGFVHLPPTGDSESRERLVPLFTSLAALALRADEVRADRTA